MNITKKELIEMFSLFETLEVVFTKVDGSERTMVCTTKSHLMKDTKDTTVQPKKTTRSDNPDVMNVYDTEKDGWRSFRVKNLTKITGLIKCLKN